MELIRCKWANTGPMETAYHDEEWGRPLHDERRLFEMLILEGMQAGLSWSTVLRKRDAFREAFDAFDPDAIARYGDEKALKLLANPGIIRNRLKIAAATKNAKAYLALREERGSLDAYLWDYVGGAPIVNRWREFADIPVTTSLSDAISKDLKKRGFTFVGSTIVYSLMQAVGMVDDHITSCFCHTDRRGDGGTGEAEA